MYYNSYYFPLDNEIKSQFGPPLDLLLKLYQQISSYPKLLIICISLVKLLICIFKPYFHIKTI